MNGGIISLLHDRPPVLKSLLTLIRNDDPVPGLCVRLIMSFSEFIEGEDTDEHVWKDPYQSRPA